MRTAVGIDLGGTNVRAALVDSSGKIIDSLREKTRVQEGPDATSKQMGLMVKELVKRHPEAIIEGVGIGSPGPLSRLERRVFKTANLPGFDNFPLGAKVEEVCGISVKLDHDAKCATYGEGLFGGAKGLKNYILLTFGTGIGGGVVVDGKMMYGKSDGACEIGHLTLYPEGELCPCGNRGCFERYASATAIERRSGKPFGSLKSAHEVFRLLGEGDKKAETLLREVALDIAIATASLVNIFDPEAIVLGGGVFTEGGGPMCQWISELMRDRCFESSQRGLRVVASTLAGNAGVLGAASLVLS